MKELIEFILLSFILTFVWNSVRRLLFAPKQRPYQQPPRQETFRKEKQQRANTHGLKWDAEDAEYEEIKDEKKN